jgi:hypothetical protein
MINSPAAENMEGVLVLADISGYTRFSHLHYTSLLHAEEIVSELLSAIIETSQFPLQVAHLEGDAVLLYAEVPDGGKTQVAQDISNQIEKLFDAFNLRERSLIACDAGCACQACNQIGELKLKAVLHFGRFSRRVFQGSVDFLGSEITLLRTLLKSLADEREYILLTQQFHDLSGDLPNQAFNEKRELFIAEQIVFAYVYFPRINLEIVNVPKGATPAFSKRLNQHSFGRMLLRRPRASFNNLPDGRMNLLLYLIEGLNSAFNIVRKNIQRAIKYRSADILIRPSVLMMVEVKAFTGMDQIMKFKFLESAVDVARPPLILNKLEDEVAFLYMIAENNSANLPYDLINQARRMFNAFTVRYSKALAENPGIAQELGSVSFRVILHAGEVALKRIRDFDELAGLNVILPHRLLQRSSAPYSSLWMTEEFCKLLDDDQAIADLPLITIGIEELGDIKVRSLRL